MTSHGRPHHYAVLGNPVAHSQSPFIHAEFARLTGEAIEYGRIECPLDGFAETVRRFAESGGGGCNVTVPFKVDAWALAAHRSDRAELAGAANVLRFDRDGWWADNTDGIGLVRDITVHAGRAIGGARVLLIGAGGAAAGVLGPLLQERPAAITLANRTPRNALLLADRHADAAAQAGVRLEVAPLDNPGADFAIVINASTSSLQGAGVPVPQTVLGRGALAVDLMYGHAAEPFLAWARQAGAEGRDGLGMLVEQAAEAFFVWRGVHPTSAPVLHALRQRLAAKP